MHEQPQMASEGMFSHLALHGMYRHKMDIRPRKHINVAKSSKRREYNLEP